MIKVKSIFAKIADDDGLRVLVEPEWPRRARHGKDLSPVWLRDLAPSHGLVDLYSSDTISWEGFISRYHQELRRNQEYFSALRERNQNGGLTLLHGSRDNDHNSAIALRMLLEEHE